MSDSISYGVTGNFAAALKKHGSDIVDKFLLDFEKGWKRGCPVKTGFARNSVQTDLTAKTVSSDCTYMEPLNNGHSKQAPAGFIEAAATRSARNINNL